MSLDNDPVPEPTLFSAVIAPHRSLDRVGFVVLMGLVGFVSFVGGIVFFIAGAWPVLGFLGLDILLIYWAFAANYRSAKAHEEVRVTASELTIRKVGERGEMREWTFNPLWVRLDREIHEEYGIERLFLVSQGKRLAIANFLGPGEKKSFAESLTTALREARRGPTRTVF